MSVSAEHQGYIHDGYTVDGYIAEEKRLYPALRFTYRPLLAQNRSVIFRQIARLDDPRKEETIAAETIRSQLNAWDLKNQKGETVDLKTSEILRVQPRLFAKLFQIITGDLPADEDPQAISAERDEQAEQDLKAVLSGESPEEADAKN